MRKLVSDAFAKEVELDRPARSHGERLFRFSIYFVGVASGLGGVSALLGFEEKIGAVLRPVLWPFSIAYLFSFFYMLIYAGYRFAPRRNVDWRLWLIILGVPTAAVVIFALLAD